MSDGTISTNKVVAVIAWLVAVVLMLMGWAVILIGFADWKVGGLLAATACLATGVAAVLHVRCYFARMFNLLRLVGAAEESQRPYAVR